VLQQTKKGGRQEMKIDLTIVFEAIITLLATLVTYKLIPYIKSKTNEHQFKFLTTAANVVVYAAEQLFGSDENEKKLDYAITQLLNCGFTVNSDTIRAAIESAVSQMKTSQLTGIVDGLDGENYSIPPLEEWPLDMIQTFCEENNIPHDGCQTKEEYIEAIVSSANVSVESESTESDTGE
jgi:hypothetical protein